MQVNILGTRGIPAAHGGFETVVAKLAPFLRDRGHTVTVYCQEEDGTPGSYHTDEWEGIHRVHFAPKRSGPRGTIEFDLACVRDVIRRSGIDLVLGYNTAIFNLVERLRGRRVVMNMDGIEWKRGKWGFVAKLWLFCNEIAGANLCSVAIADHPEIAVHIGRRCFKKPFVIPYGSDWVERADPELLEPLGLTPGRYIVSIARIEPENSILEIVTAFNRISNDHPGIRCVVLGKFEDAYSYHKSIKAAAGPGMLFPGAIYDKEVLNAIRLHAVAYLHGHRVGGTNPSLVEALGAGMPIIAHDNRFNRWTAGGKQRFFSTTEEATAQMCQVLADSALRRQMSAAARARHAEAFHWTPILEAYEDALSGVLR